MTQKSVNSRFARGIAFGVAILGYLLLSFASSSAVNENVVAEQITAPQNDTIKETKNRKKRGSDEPLLVDYWALVTSNLGDGIIRMVGEVKFHHNGAIIVCDSAHLYSDDNRIEFFSNVIIEKDSAYIYGDRVLYNGETDIADVFAPIVKTIQGDAVMYSYNLKFNTNTSIGTFIGGGVLSQKDNLMEAENGWFDADNEYVKFLDSVSMRNDKYLLKTDSLGFSVAVERVDFLTKTYIWDNERDFLMADGGHYFSATATYLFTSNAYAMTPDNELWADTMRYMTDVKQAYMFSNVQILDTANAVLGFGDWAYYDDSIGRAILTKTPSVRGWDKGDTSFMKADTIMLLTFEPGMSKVEPEEDDFDVTDATDSENNSAIATESDTTVVKDYAGFRDSLKTQDSLNRLTIDSLQTVDSLQVTDVLKAVDSLLGDEVLQRDSLVVVDEYATQTNDTVTVNQTEVVDVVVVGEAKQQEKEIVEQTAKKGGKKAKKEPKPKREKRSRANKDEVEGQNSANDLTVKDNGEKGLEDVSVDTLKVANDNFSVQDSLLTASDSSLIHLDTLGNDTIVKEPQKERVLRAYRNVRIWSEEYQAKCDSTVSFSVDSTLVMYIEPVLWSKANQITSEMIELFTKNEELDWADFTGDPFIAQQVVRNDTTMYNQATGKRLEAFFTNNELDYTYMSGNVQNIYYMDEEQEVVALAAIECADLTMIFAEREPTRMIWSGSGEGPIYPIEKIPAEQSRFLSGFTWQDSIRPNSASEICKRVVRASLRESVDSFNAPVFRIEGVMEEAKKRFKGLGVWSDRVDVPTITPKFFEDMRSDFLF